MASKPEPLIMAEQELLAPTGQRFLLEGVEMPKTEEGYPKPWFSSDEVAKCFFGRGSWWIRWRLRSTKDHPDGHFVLDGKPLEFVRGRQLQRKFSLFDIEKMAHSLAQQGDITPTQLAKTIHIVKTCAELHGVI